MTNIMSKKFQLFYLQFEDLYDYKESYLKYEDKYEHLPNITDFVNSILFYKMTTFPRFNPIMYYNYSVFMVGRTIEKKVWSRTRKNNNYDLYIKVLKILNNAQIKFKQKVQPYGVARKFDVPDISKDQIPYINKGHFLYLLHTIPKFNR